MTVGEKEYAQFIKHLAVLLGDSYYGYEAVTRAGFELIFLSGWSGLEGGVSFFEFNNLRTNKYIKELLEY